MDIFLYILIFSFFSCKYFILGGNFGLMKMGQLVQRSWLSLLYFLKGIKEKKNLATNGIAVAQWLRYCATNRKVTGSIPDGVIGIFR
jgi:hypothetical protein